MHTNMTAVTIQSNKIVSNAVDRQLSTSRAIVWEKQTNFLANPVHGLPTLPPLRSVSLASMTKATTEIQP